MFCNVSEGATLVDLYWSSERNDRAEQGCRRCQNLHVKRKLIKDNLRMSESPEPKVLSGRSGTRQPVFMLSTREGEEREHFFRLPATTETQCGSLSVLE